MFVVELTLLKNAEVHAGNPATDFMTIDFKPIRPRTCTVASDVSWFDRVFRNERPGTVITHDAVKEPVLTLRAGQAKRIKLMLGNTGFHHNPKASVFYTMFKRFEQRLFYFSTKEVRSAAVCFYVCVQPGTGTQSKKHYLRRCRDFFERAEEGQNIVFVERKFKPLTYLKLLLTGY